MEIFLLLLDEIDDAVATLRMLWSRLLGFFIACGLFALSIVTAMHWPVLAVVALLCVIAWTALHATVFTRQRFKTDP